MEDLADPTWVLALAEALASEVLTGITDTMGTTGITDRIFSIAARIS